MACWGVLAGVAQAQNLDDACHATRAPLLSPVTLEATKAARESYLDLVEKGNLTNLTEVGEMRKGHWGHGVRLLQARLREEGDLAPEVSRPGVFDTLLEEALQRLQRRYGLPASGRLDKATLAALNVAPEFRLHQLETNVLRLEKLVAEASAHMVTVNLPDMQVEAVADGRVVARYKAVVGAASRPSPVLTTLIVGLTVHPSWTVPASLAWQDIIPLERRQPGHLASHGFHVYDASGKELDLATLDWEGEDLRYYTFRQEARPDNPLGRLRLDMPNPYAAYMHDTPAQQVFLQHCRMQSSGCVRVENIEQLAAWLPAAMPEWTPERLSHLLAEGKPRYVPLRESVPVAWVYVTAWATAEGRTCFRPDIYGHDPTR